jgi:hypothetical protein
LVGLSKRKGGDHVQAVRLELRRQAPGDQGGAGSPFGVDRQPYFTAFSFGASPR